jgi:hypothetical protein
MAEITRVIALGASNLTRGFHTIVSTSRAAWGPEVQVLAALGHGRSYGVSRTVGICTLPGILESGLWRALESLPVVPTRAIVSDVGNDIMYGHSAERILSWIEDALRRLQSVTDDITLTDLPLASIRRISQTKYLLFRSFLFPFCGLSLAQVLDTAERVNSGLAELSIKHGVNFFRLNPNWYGSDPIHIRPSLWRSAWQQILNAGSLSSNRKSSLLEGLRLYFMANERRRILGIAQFTPQSGVALPAGGRVWLY